MILFFSDITAATITPVHKLLGWARARTANRAKVAGKALVHRRDVVRLRFTREER